MSGDEVRSGLAVWWGDPAVTGSTSAGSFVLPAGTVGFLLTDVEGSTRLWEADSEAMAAAMAIHARILDQAVSAHGGVCPPAQGEGDSVVAAFARASDAVLAARDAQRALVAEAWPTPGPLRVRMAVHAGEARVVDDGNYAGQAIIRAARLRTIAHGGQVLVSAAARDLTVDQLGDSVGLVDVGEHRLKDLARPEHVYQLTDGAIPDHFPPLASLDAHPHNLPVQLSSFIGRAAEMATVAGLVEGNRLVTVTGAGGAGKTRLALQVAAEMVDGYPDGVWWVELAEVADAGLIAAAVAAAVGVKADVGEQASSVLAERLADKRLLVVLDNCEHLVAGVAELVDRLLRRGGGVAVLATSREPLEVSGEVAWRIPPLAVPRTGGPPTPIEGLSQFDGVRLFVDRARQVRPNFHLTDENGPAVAGICERLDGIPLALELAAARCRSLSPAQILAGLADAFRLLTGGGRSALARQQTLEASIAWSHDLLTPAEQVLLRRLSVFRGGCTLDDAEAVVAGDGLAAVEVLDGLDRLVAQSLLQLDDSDAGDVRYRVLETVRQYGARHLDAAGETARVGDRHARHYAAIAEHYGPQLETGQDIAAFGRLVADLDNLRAAFEWLAETDRWDEYPGAAWGCAFLWLLVSPAEGIAQLSKPLAADSLRDPALTARLLCGRAFIEQACGRYAEALADLEKAIGLGEQLGDDGIVGRANARLGLIISMADPVPGGELLARAAERCHRANDSYGEAEAQLYRANALLGSGHDTERSWTLLADAQTLANHCGAHWLLAVGHSFASLFAAAQGDFGRALAEADSGEADLRALARRARLDVDRFVRVEAIGSSIELARALVAVATGERRDVLDRLSSLIRDTRADGSPSVARGLTIVQALDHAANGDLQTARSLLDPIVDAGGALIWAALGLAADVARAIGDLSAAKRLLDQTETATTRSSPLQHFCNTTLSRAALALHTGELGRAEDLAHQELAVAHDEQFRIELVACFELLADIAAANHDWQHAARLHGAARRLRTETGITVRLAGYGDEHDRAMAASAEALGGDAYASAIAEGAGLGVDAAVAYAERSRGERKRPAFGWDSLTPTELDVAGLVVAGLTNPQIGQQLLVSTDTVKTHLAHIFTKLAIHTRTELAAHAVQHQQPDAGG